MSPSIIVQFHVGPQKNKKNNNQVSAAARLCLGLKCSGSREVPMPTMLILPTRSTKSILPTMSTIHVFSWLIMLYSSSGSRCQQYQQWFQQCKQCHQSDLQLVDHVRVEALREVRSTKRAAGHRALNGGGSHCKIWKQGVLNMYIVHV